MNTIGQNIRLARKQAGFSYKELAEKASVARTSIIEYELDYHQPGIYNAASIAKALGVTIDWLVYNEEDKP